jgi:hypothetical protein
MSKAERALHRAIADDGDALHATLGRPVVGRCAIHFGTDSRREVGQLIRFEIPERRCHAASPLLGH